MCLVWCIFQIFARLLSWNMIVKYGRNAFAVLMHHHPSYVGLAEQR